MRLCESVCVCVCVVGDRCTLASVPGLPRSVRVLIMRMRKRQTFEERGRPGWKHHVRVDVG